MRDTELYRHLLGLVAPWAVERVGLSAEEGRVDVWVVHPGRTRFACADCERKLSVYDRCEERAWRHLDSCAFLTFLHASPPPVACSERVRQARLSSAEAHSRFTTLFERLRSTCSPRATWTLLPGCRGSAGTKRGTSWTAPCPRPGRQTAGCADPRRRR